MNNISIKKQTVNITTNKDLTNKNIINNNENVLSVKKDYSYKTYVSNNYKSHVGYVGNNLYKKQDNRTCNNTNNMYKHINQYSTDVFNNYKINKTQHVTKTQYNFNNGVFLLINITPLTLMVHTI